MFLVINMNSHAPKVSRLDSLGQSLMAQQSLMANRVGLKCEPPSTTSSVSGDTLDGCSRRNVLKRRKICHFCKEHFTHLVTEVDGNTGELYSFCGADCARAFKDDVFMRETRACLQPTAIDTQESPTAAVPKRSDVNRPITASTTGSSLVVVNAVRARRRAQQRFRPHPSYRLNKRYWDKIKSIGGSGAAGAVSSSGAKLSAAPNNNKNVRPPTTTSANDMRSEQQRTCAPPAPALTNQASVVRPRLPPPPPLFYRSAPFAGLRPPPPGPLYIPTAAPARLRPPPFLSPPPPPPAPISFVPVPVPIVVPILVEQEFVQRIAQRMQQQQQVNDFALD